MAQVVDPLALSASIPGSGSVASSFRYDGAGRMTSRADAAGTATFTYTPRGELDVANDPLTGKTVNHDWNDAGQVATITYGTSPAATRTFAYDGRGRVDTDTLTGASGTLAAADYGYDPEGNLTGQIIVAPGNPAAGAHGYTYTRSGRLDTWTAPGGTVTDYDYDAAGNRTRAGNTFSAYDARNRLATETVFDTAAPSVPADLAAIASGQRTVDLTWAASTDDTAVAGYTVLRDDVVVGTTTATSFTDQTAVPAIAYSYRVEAFDGAANRSAASAPAAATTPAFVPATVAFKAATTNSAASATSLSIAKPAGTATGDRLVAVLAVRGTSNVTATGWDPVRSVPNGTTMKLVTLTKAAAAGDGSYPFTISPAGSVAGVVAAYTGVSTVVPLDGELGQPNASSTVVTAPSVTTTAANDMLVGGFGTAASTTFTAPSGPGSMAVRAQRAQSGSNKVSVAIAELALGAPAATGDKTLNAGTGALNAGQLVALRPAGAEPADTTMPGAPGTPVATPAGGPVQVGLSWPAGTDNVGVASYRISRDGTLIGHASTAAFTDTQVAASTSYSYTVETVDAAGNRSTPSPAVNVTSLAGAAGSLATAYTWSARGTLSTLNDGAPTAVGFDALGRQTAWGATAYGYDDLDRITTRGATTFGYAGLEIDPVAVGGERYSRTPAGELLGAQVNGAARLVGENRHGDVAWLLDPTGTLTDSRIWDPYGQNAGTTGTTAASVGYQGDYTDPASGNVWMGARWYQPTTGGFTSRDLVFGMLRTPVSLNRYTYGNGDPLQYFDPDGRFGFSTLTNAASSAWNNTGGRVVSTVNRSVVQPVVRSMPASVRAAAARMATSARSLPRKAASAYLTVRRAKASAQQYVARLQAGYVRGFAAGGYETAKGLVHLATNPTELVHLARAMVDDPGGTAKAIYHGTVDPIEDAIDRGEYGEAGGRFGFEALSFGLGPKGATKAGSAIANGARKAVTGLEDFAASPAAQKALTTLADETGAVGGATSQAAEDAARFVVDSAGSATLRARGPQGWINVSDHAAQRMTQRGIAIDAVDGALTQQPFRYWHEGVWKTGYYDPASRVFVGTVNDVATTVIRTGPNYINNLKAAAP